MLCDAELRCSMVLCNAALSCFAVLCVLCRHEKPPGRREAARGGRVRQRRHVPVFPQGGAHLCVQARQHHRHPYQPVQCSECWSTIRGNHADFQSIFNLQWQEPCEGPKDTQSTPINGAEAELMHLRPISICPSTSCPLCSDWPPSHTLPLPPQPPSHTLHLTT